MINTFPDEFSVEGAEKDKDVRYVEQKIDSGIIEFLFVKEPRIARSNKVLNAFTSAMTILLEESLKNNVQRAQEMADDYLHNIKKIHGNQKSIIERCVSGAEEQENYQEFVKSVAREVQENPSVTAEDICALSKEIRLIDYHIGGYNLLRDNSSRIAITDNHDLRKFLLGLSHLFFDSFSKNKVLVSLHEIDKDFRCSFEYETFNVAMHSFLENIVKYSKPYSKVRIYTQNTGQLIFQMESIRLEKDELTSIFKRGVSGRNVPDDLRGNGIGMYQLKKALDRSNISISIRPNYSKNSDLNGIQYAENIFSFTFPKFSFRDVSF